MKWPVGINGRVYIYREVRTRGQMREENNFRNAIDVVVHIRAHLSSHGPTRSPEPLMKLSTASLPSREYIEIRCQFKILFCLLYITYRNQLHKEKKYDP